MNDVFTYAMGSGVCLEEDYKYTAKDGKCKASKCTIDTGISGIANIEAGDLDAAMAATELKPLAIAVDANDWSFYSSGIHKCGGTDLDHGVVLEGFHLNDNEGDYLIVRNSWGPRWGESGLIRIDIDANCGAAQAASYPTFTSESAAS